MESANIKAGQGDSGRTRELLLTPLTTATPRRTKTRRWLILILVLIAVIALVLWLLRLRATETRAADPTPTPTRQARPPSRRIAPTWR